MAAIEAHDVEWVVNNKAELGVKIGNQFFWYYKCSSLEYAHPKAPYSEVTHWRYASRHEFGTDIYPVRHYTEGLSPEECLQVGGLHPWQPIPTADASVEKRNGGYYVDWFDSNRRLTGWQVVSWKLRLTSANKLAHELIGRPLE